MENININQEKQEINKNIKGMGDINLDMKRYLLERGMTQAKFARGLEVNLSQFSLMINGNIGIPKSLAEKIEKKTKGVVSVSSWSAIRRPMPKDKNAVPDTKKIKKLMIDNDLTETEAGRRLGTSSSSICDVIAGRKKTPDLQEGLARLLGVPVSRIFRVKKDS